MTKPEIKAELKRALTEAGVIFKTSKQPGSFLDVRGGSLGPMTCFPEYCHDENRKREKMMICILRDAGALDMVSFSIVDRWTYEGQPRCNYDVGYRTFWLVLSWKDATK